MPYPRSMSPNTGRSTYIAGALSFIAFFLLTTIAFSHSLEKPMSVAVSLESSPGEIDRFHHFALLLMESEKAEIADLGRLARSMAEALETGDAEGFVGMQAVMNYRVSKFTEELEMELLKTEIRMTNRLKNIPSPVNGLRWRCIESNSAGCIPDYNEVCFASMTAGGMVCVDSCPGDAICAEFADAPSHVENRDVLRTCCIPPGAEGSESIEACMFNVELRRTDPPHTD